MGGTLSYLRGNGNDADINMKKYGWRPDTPDVRDKYFKPKAEVSNITTGDVDLREQCLVYTTKAIRELLLMLQQLHMSLMKSRKMRTIYLF